MDIQKILLVALVAVVLSLVIIQGTTHAIDNQNQEQTESCVSCCGDNCESCCGNGFCNNIEQSNIGCGCS